MRIPRRSSIFLTIHTGVRAQTVLFESEILRLRAVRCASAPSGCGPIEWSEANTIVFPDTDGDEIFLEARTALGLPQRWIFSAITPNSFHWRNIMTPDDGSTWQLLEDVEARRADASARSR